VLHLCLWFVFRFRQNLYLNFGEIGSNIKQLMEEFQQRSKSQAKVDSIADMKVCYNSVPYYNRDLCLCRLMIKPPLRVLLMHPNKQFSFKFVAEPDGSQRCTADSLW